MQIDAETIERLNLQSELLLTMYQLELAKALAAMPPDPPVAI
jgi:hypothetical protein